MREPGKLGTSTIGIDRIATNEIFFVSIIQVLPAGHPGDGAVRDMVRETWLTEQLRQVSASGFSIEMVAEISSKLSAGVRDSIRPMTRFGVEHDARRFDASGRDYDRAPVDFNFLPRVAVDIGNPGGL